MAQPDIPPIGNHREGIRNGSQGIHNQVAPFANMPAVVGHNNLRQEMREVRKEIRQSMKAGRLEAKAWREQSDRNHIQIMGILQEIRGQLGQIQNEYLYWSSFGKRA